MSPSRSIALPDLSSDVLQRRAFAAHEALGQGESVDGNLRGIVQDSWLRSLTFFPNPSSAHASLYCSEEELEAYRQGHPLAAIMPVIDRLLVQPSLDSGMLVAVGDENGRLLWVDGDRELRRRAEGMLFMAGADWSEATVGTSAPGTALALQRSVQIAGAEHFNPQVHPWSCTAVPLHDPDSGTVLGVIDITGAAEAVATHTLALVEAAVAAAEAQLSIHRLQSRLSGTKRHRTAPTAGTLYRDSLQILGTDHGVVHAGGASLELSLRHAELLTLLALHPEGLTADQLAVMAYPENASSTTVRAEMLRLRKALTQHGGGIVPQSRPYRLPGELVVDAVQVLNYLRRGAHRMALAIYRGPVLPRSQAPAIVRLRAEVSTLLRDAVLTDGAPETVLQYLALPEAEDDVESWSLALRVLPRRSPRRAVVVAHVERLEAELMVPSASKLKFS
ncbi:GAF domain-containing protein [Arthrobacter cheniae]|uniref:GAF domain-containing protein n=1 Tax=Arthrobacter cheniae TaxID=1258888 RepID=A0A3A5MIN2_9MICC|nr:GAF domain-containing protein [Arthrobacter cheniae]RJT83084.1 GAF domain-containing protein [Arthrobacter cheniae]